MPQCDNTSGSFWFCQPIAGGAKIASVFPYTLHPTPYTLGGNLLANVLLEDAVAIGMAQLAQSLRFNLANSLPGDVEDLADFF